MKKAGGESGDREGLPTGASPRPPPPAQHPHAGERSAVPRMMQRGKSSPAESFAAIFSRRPQRNPGAGNCPARQLLTKGPLKPVAPRPDRGGGRTGVDWGGGLWGALQDAGWQEAPPQIQLPFREDSRAQCVTFSAWAAAPGLPGDTTQHPRTPTPQHRPTIPNETRGAQLHFRAAATNPRSSRFSSCKPRSGTRPGLPPDVPSSSPSLSWDHQHWCSGHPREASPQVIGAGEKDILYG